MPRRTTSVLPFFAVACVLGACAPSPAAHRDVSREILDEHAAFALDGHERRATIVHPHEPAEPPPLLLVLHGVGGDRDRIRAFTAGAFDRLAADEGVLVAYPEAFEGVWNDCRATGDSAARRAEIDDVAFLEAVIEFVRDSAGGELGGVFVAGYSNGGQMALRLALEAPELVDGVAMFGALLPVEDDCTCPIDGAPVPLMLVAGTDDPICPFDGGLVTPPAGPARGAVRSAHASATWLARRAGHSGPPAVVERPDSDPDDGCRLIEYRWSGGGGPEVTLLEVLGGGHALPLIGASFPEPVGATAHDIDGALTIWAFCERQVGQVGQ